MKDKIIKDDQEQAVASWINYLNQIRLDELMSALSEEKENYIEAMQTIKETLDTIDISIVNNGAGRGGVRGMHGFIAEVAECGIGNARSQIEGKIPIYEWINDNGSVDLIRGTTLIQQKFANYGGHLSLQAIKEHLEAYPDFLNKGGIYQIPSDHYDKIQWYLSIPESQANKMDTTKGDFSLKQWKEVHEFFGDESVKIDSIEPSKLDYNSVQRDKYEDTLKDESKYLKDRNRERRKEAYQKSKPSFKEGTKATIASAVIDGGTNCFIVIYQKRKEGKKITDFSSEDWKDVFGESGKGFVKGGVRGSSIYVLTNYTATPAAVASSMVTASFGIADLAYKLKKGDIDELSFIEESEMLCLDATVSALSSLAGQIFIPIPVLGAVIGNSIGTIMYHAAKNIASSRIDKLIEKYIEEINEYDLELHAEYVSFINELSIEMIRYLDILDRAFSPDIRIAFNGSIEFARKLGISDDEILDTTDKIDSYFMG